MIKCPFCKSLRNKCYGGMKTYLRPDNVYVRYRKCMECGKTFNTQECYYPDGIVKQVQRQQINERRKEKIKNGTDREYTRT